MPYPDIAALCRPLLLALLRDTLTECRRVQPARDFMVHKLERRRASGAAYRHVWKETKEKLTPVWQGAARPGLVGYRYRPRSATASKNWAKGIYWAEKSHIEQQRSKVGIHAHLDVKVDDHSHDQNGEVNDLGSSKSLRAMSAHLAKLERRIASGATGYEARYHKLLDTIQASNPGLEPVYGLGGPPAVPAEIRIPALRILKDWPAPRRGRPPDGDRARTRAEQKRIERDRKRQLKWEAKANAGPNGNGEFSDRPEAREVACEPEGT
jgi:hypothetical protein